MFEAIPWSAFVDDPVHFWIHYGLVILGFILAIITVIVQWTQPAPYGKHEKQSSNWGAMIPQRIGHMLSDAVPGILLFILVFFLCGQQRKAVNIVFLVLFEIHYIHRGLIHPFYMNYSNPKVALGITLGGFFPNCLFHGLNSDWIGSANYVENYYYDPRFIIGILLYVIGFIINRHSDWTLRNLRKHGGSNKTYYIPRGGMFELVSCPNYLGELIQWLGWALSTWSLAGLIWCLFSAATFIPRAHHNHTWYKQQFELYPPHRKALIPFLY